MAGPVRCGSTAMAAKGWESCHQDRMAFQNTPFVTSGSPNRGPVERPAMISLGNITAACRTSVLFALVMVSVFVATIATGRETPAAALPFLLDR